MVKRAFKTDESFLEKISIGAIGTRQVFSNLKRQGHNPIELERCSMSYKIWKAIKIKRVRVPDILCVDCGNRVESRAKTKLEITMSHSISNADRGWDHGLNDKDSIALVKCTKSGERPIDWTPSTLVQYISVSSMRKAFKEKKITIEQAKGATEGFETRVTWPSAIASSDGKVTNINSDRIQYSRSSDKRIITLALQRNGTKLLPLVKVGEEIKENQIIASVVPVSSSFSCTKKCKENNYLTSLQSNDLSERYAAAKALSYFDSKKSEAALLSSMNNQSEHIYVRLESAASLLKRGITESLRFFADILKDTYLENRLECVIILGEIKKPESCDLLISTLLDNSQHPEIRAGAAWSLGESMNKKALSVLVKAFNDVELEVRAEAARAMNKLNTNFIKDTIKLFSQSDETARAGIAWSISKSGNFKIEDLSGMLADPEARKWLAWIIGTQDEEKYIHEIEGLRERDKEVYFAVTVLWKIMSSWIDGLDLY